MIIETPQQSRTHVEVKLEKACNQYLRYAHLRAPQSSTLFPYTTLFRSRRVSRESSARDESAADGGLNRRRPTGTRSEEHTSELQSRGHLVCRLLLEKKKLSFSLAAVA